MGDDAGHDRPAGRLTILQAPGKRLTKVYGRDRKGRVVKRPYDRATWFHASTRSVGSVDELAEQLRWLQRRPDCCIIRGVPGRFHPGPGRAAQRRLYAAAELADGEGDFQKVARNGSGEVWQRREVDAGRLFPVTVLPAFEEWPTRVLLIDFDRAIAPAGVDWRADLAWTATFLQLKLPAEFHGCRAVYYATSSAADLTKPDLGGAEIRMRLGFVLDRGVTAAEAKRWLAGVDGLDPSTLNTVQPIYTAAPLFGDGLSDPLPERLGLLDSGRELVAVPELRVEQRYRREAFAALGPVRSAEGLGLVRPHPRLDAALERLDECGGAAGTVRSGLMQAAFAYVGDAGRDHVDVEALAAFLAEAGERHRTPGEVAGYGLEDMVAWALERAPDESPPRPHHPDAGLPADEALARLRAEMAAAVGAAVAWRATADGEPDPDLAPPVVGIKAGAGLGKTGCALEEIADIPGVEALNVEVYVPDHRLAGELVARARAAAPHLRVLLIRGRGAADGDGEAMCAKAGLAEELGRAGLNVASSLCRLKGEKGQPDQSCEFADGCRYLAQFADAAPAVRILPHAAMFVRRNQTLPEPDLIVVDESFWQNAPVHQRLALDRLTEAGRWRPRPRKGESGGKAGDRLLEAEDFSRRVQLALLDGRDPRAVVTAEECELVAGVEWNSRTGPGITPGMPYERQRQAWASWQRDECAKAGRFWSLLADEHRHPGRPLQRIVLERDAVTKDGDRRHLLHLHHRRELHLPRAPVILLDADLDPPIAGKFFPALRVVEIPVRQLAEIVQVVDRTCSMRFLLGGGEGDERRADNRLKELERFAARALGSGGLFVGYKAANDRMPLPAGVDAVHLGNLRGRDGYKRHDAAVVAGRLELPVVELERMARAVFGDEAEPIRTVAPGEHGGTRYPSEPRRYRLAGGGAGQAVDVAVHPDPRAQALLEQRRERELEQAVARLRLVHPRERPATVYLLTNLPLNLEVVTLTTWNELCRDREAEAVRRWGGVWLCSAGERAKAAPDLWSTAAAAKEAAARGRRGGKGVTNPSKDSLEDSVTPFPPYPAWGSTPLNREAATLVEYRYPGQRGSAHKAYLPGSVWCEVTARADLEAVLPAPPSTLAILSPVRRDQPGVPIQPTASPVGRMPGVVHDPGEPVPLVVRCRQKIPYQLGALGIGRASSGPSARPPTWPRARFARSGRRRR